MNKQTGPRSSIRQVAGLAGVSAMTVSNVLRNRTHLVTEDKRSRVLQAIQELNYIPIQPAVQNRHVETKAIGVVFLEDMQGLLGLRTFAGIRKQAQLGEYDLLIVLRPQPNWMAPGAEAQFLDRRCDGYIFVGNGPLEVMEKLVDHGVPTVVCYRAEAPQGVGTVLADGMEGMRLSVDHLMAQGHERIGHLAGPFDSNEAAQRLEGFRRAMQARCNPYADCIVQGDSWGHNETQARPTPGVAALADQLFAAGVTAVVCANDFLALDLWHLAEAKGLRVPADLSLTGMDNIEFAAQQGLTSLVNPFDEIGRKAVDLLITLLKGGDTAEAHTLVPVTLIERHSVSKR